MDPAVEVEEGKQPPPWWAELVCSLDLRPVWKHFRFPKYSVPCAGPDGYENIYSGRHGVAHHYQRSESDWVPSERGGYSFCYLYDVDGEVVATGHADCSHKDHFCYQKGCKISLSRALFRLSPEYELREERRNGRTATPA